MDIATLSILNKVSNIERATRNTLKYLGKGAILYISNRKNKKYMVLDPNTLIELLASEVTNKYISFGDIRYIDYTKSLDKDKRDRYLKRATLIELLASEVTKIKGDWANNKYSPNNLAINILWA
jgi:hypothetical protein